MQSSVSSPDFDSPKQKSHAPQLGSLVFLTEVSEEPLCRHTGAGQTGRISHGAGAFGSNRGLGARASWADLSHQAIPTHEIGRE